MPANGYPAGCCEIRERVEFPIRKIRIRSQSFGRTDGGVAGKPREWAGGCVKAKWKAKDLLVCCEITSAFTTRRMRGVALNPIPRERYSGHPAHPLLHSGNRIIPENTSFPARSYCSAVQTRLRANCASCTVEAARLFLFFLPWLVCAKCT